MMKRFGTIIVFCLIGQLALSAKCPPRKDIKPCRCFGGFDLQVTCAKLTHYEQLEKVVKALQNTTIYIFEITDSKIADIPNDIFDGLVVEDLDVKRSTLYARNPEQPIFVGLENSVENIYIDKVNPGEPLAHLYVGHLKKLRTLDLDRNHIPIIKSSWFSDGPVSLKELSFIDSEVDTIEDEAFQNLTNLEYLTIRMNRKLETLTRSMLPHPAKSLRSLNLGRNNLTSLPKDFFKDLPRLTEVSLYDNFLTTISEEVFSPIIDNLHVLELYGNPLICDEKIKWLYKKKSIWFRVTGTCAEPPKWKGRDLETVNPDEL